MPYQRALQRPNFRQVPSCFSDQAQNLSNIILITLHFRHSEYSYDQYIQKSYDNILLIKKTLNCYKPLLTIVQRPFSNYIFHALKLANQ
jgi:hypothetical protein